MAAETDHKEYVERVLLNLDFPLAKRVLDELDGTSVYGLRSRAARLVASSDRLGKVSGRTPTQFRSKQHAKHRALNSTRIS